MALHKGVTFERKTKHISMKQRSQENNIIV